LIQKSQIIGDDRGSGEPKEQSQLPNSGFDRKVSMEWSSFWDRPSKQHRRGLSDASSARSRSGSNASNPGIADGRSDNPDIADSSRSRAKGYAFISPWNGTCKFSTGGGGRSLRCKHTLPDSASRNSISSASSSQMTVTVSELRFNLPTTTIFDAAAARIRRDSDTTHFTLPKLSSIQNKLSPGKGPLPPLPPRPHPTSYAAMYPSDEDEAPPLPPRRDSSLDKVEYSSDADESRLDLSIGREKAGGGNRGKRAKLGKLIIHDEGLKMLDLIVAANMGVWWSVWEPGQP